MNIQRLMCTVVALTTMALAGCGGGGGGGGSMPDSMTGGGSGSTPDSMTGDGSGSMPDTQQPGGGSMPSVTVFGDLNVDQTVADNIVTAIGRAAKATPLAGSVTQSSNVDSNGITTDQVDVTAEYGATSPSFSIRNGTEWSIGMGEGNPSPISDVPAPWKGSGLSKRVSGGTLYVEAYSDIEAPETTTTGGQPQDVMSGDQIFGLTCLGTTCSPGSQAGTLNGVSGTFSCPAGCSVQFPGISLSSGNSINLHNTTINGQTFGVDTFDVLSAMGITFTPSGGGTTQTTPDTDYLSGGVWLIVLDNATSADDYVFGAFADGSDPFDQANLVALLGTATYVGGANGVYSEKTAESTSIGYFDGDVELTADFGDASGLGTISGSITNFEVDGEPTDGALNLGAANIGSQDSGFFQGAVTGSDNDRSYTGSWGGQFFGNGELDGRPGSVGGTFGGSSTDDAVNFVGAFGAHKQ